MRGVFGICTEGDCVGELFRGTVGLQHRGQSYGGLSTSDGERIKIRTHRGLFVRTFEDDLEGMEGWCGIGHTSSQDRQPILIDSRLGEFCLGFDGYIMNADELRRELMADGSWFCTNEHAELLCGLITQEKSIPDGLARALLKIVGPCALVILTCEGIYAARGLHGGRPLVLGRGDGCWAVASESCAFNHGIRLKLERDVAPGEVVFIDQEGFSTLKRLEGRLKYCSFEWIYYARPDSIIEGISVTAVRHNLGRFLAEQDNVEADIVGPVPFSGIMHAEGYHLGSELPSQEVFLLPQYILRTYILSIEERKREKARKLVPIRENVEGQRLVLVDDSIRSGITMRGLVKSLRDAGAKEVHVRIASPLSIRYCPYARPPLEEEQFIAVSHSAEEIRRFIGADSLRFQELNNIPRAIGLPMEALCLDCFLKGR